MPSYEALIERPDGSTYVQPFNDFYELLELRDTLGDEYLIVEVY